jgi:hypothetical protein
VIGMTQTTPVERPATAQGRSALTAWTGVLFFVLFPAGVIFSGNDLDNNDSDAKWRAWFADSGNRTGNIIGIYLLVIAALLFVVFASGLLERMRAAGAPSVAHRVATLSAAMFAVVTMIAAIEMGGVSGNITFGDTPVPKNADIMRQSLGYGTLAVAGALTAAVFIVSVAMLARQTGALPNWLVIVSYIAAVILLGAVVFLPLAALPIWVLIVSILLLRRRA